MAKSKQKKSEQYYRPKLHLPWYRFLNPAYLFLHRLWMNFYTFLFNPTFSEHESLFKQELGKR